MNNKMNKQTQVHVSLNIAELLRTTNKNIEEKTGMSGKAARHELNMKRKKGEVYLPHKDCDNFDPEKGCLGH